ncbi:hypothetical protein EIP86_002419 [Pleurotus ostreatoroseus]|nr:hypothetical protein EIP86_002419 [Pleurotus ostreatoroseus]
MFGLRTLTSTLFAAFVLSSSSVATPLPAATAAIIKPQEFDVYTPSISAPNASTIWQPGETQVVTWSTADLDDTGKEAVGYLLLGYLENDSENLDIKHPLATGFHLGDGQTTVTVPNVPTRDDYIVVLLGDSGNTSPQFTIQNPQTSVSSSSASSTATASA